MRDSLFPFFFLFSFFLCLLRRSEVVLAEFSGVRVTMHLFIYLFFFPLKNHISAPAKTVSECGELAARISLVNGGGKNFAALIEECNQRLEEAGLGMTLKRVAEEKVTRFYLFIFYFSCFHVFVLIPGWDCALGSCQHQDGFCFSANRN